LKGVFGMKKIGEVYVIYKPYFDRWGVQRVDLLYAVRTKEEAIEALIRHKTPDERVVCGFKKLAVVQLD